jgi:hypothetical protein
MVQENSSLQHLCPVRVARLAWHVHGIADPLALEERLASVLSDGFAPHLVQDIEVLPWRSTNVVAVQVYPSPSRPHYLKSVGVDAGGGLCAGRLDQPARGW